MPKIDVARLRPAFAAALLLSLALLAGCQSEPAPPPQTDSTALAGLTPTDPGTGATDPRQAALDGLMRVGDRVFFATDQYDISSAAEATLRAQAALLQFYPAITVTIEGHADERGTREYNLALADRRAAAVRNYLVALGVSTERVETVSYGKERPACAEASDDCWAKNRRGVTVVNQ